MFSILKRIFRRGSVKVPRPEPVSLSPDGAEAADAKPEKTPVPAPAAAVSTNAVDAPSKIRKKTPRRRKQPPSDPGQHQRRSALRNRHGIPVFQKDADISRLFENRPKETVLDAEGRHQAAASMAPRRKVRRPAKNKNGIPVFREDTDFSLYFRDVPSRSVPVGDPTAARRVSKSVSEDFQVLLEESLAGKTAEMLLGEKCDRRLNDGDMTPEQTIRQYPPPQEELDLHGKTAREAIESTRRFVETSRYRGKRTLLVIVGKGLHSEGRAVLPDVVEAELARLRQSGRILAHRWERGARRKSGAIIVYLNPM
ncbi:hypothetical protein B2D07_06310 [Desulfococcus multivorans]|jgi:DNA-nicking Smr family endonuclease|nr:hypothetical protein B2D07_06310 [Desulfococcus multivorans]